MRFEDAARAHIEAKEDTIRKVSLFPVVVPFGTSPLWTGSGGGLAEWSLGRQDDLSGANLDRSEPAAA